MILVRNEYKSGTSNYIFPGDKPRVLQAGSTGIISEAEWSTVPMGLRGPGGINPIDEDADITIGRTFLDYFIATDGGGSPLDGSSQLRYQGTAAQGTATTDPTWTIRRFSYLLDTDSNVVFSEIQTLQDVAWGSTQADRDGLPWTP